MKFDNLVRTEQFIKSKWVTYYLTLNGKYFKLTTKTAMEMLEAFDLVEGITNKEVNGLTTTIYYQR
jgi:hypothetical protein